MFKVNFNKCKVVPLSTLFTPSPSPVFFERKRRAGISVPVPRNARIRAYLGSGTCVWIIPEVMTNGRRIVADNKELRRSCKTQAGVAFVSESEAPHIPWYPQQDVESRGWLSSDLTRVLGKPLFF